MPEQAELNRVEKNHCLKRQAKKKKKEWLEMPNKFYPTKKTPFFSLCLLPQPLQLHLHKTM